MRPAWYARPAFAATIAVVLAAAVVVGTLVFKDDGPSTDGPVLDGTYRLEFAGYAQLLNGEPKAGDVPASQYALRSACSDGACIATAIRLNDSDSALAAERRITPVLDYLGGQWITTFATQSKCGTGMATRLTSWTLTPQDDGTLTGVARTALVADDCAMNLEVPMTMTRTGDVSSSVMVADPAQQEPHQPSTIAGFHGLYESTAKDPGGSGEPTQVERTITTTCVRNTEQCLTFSAGDELTFAYESGDGRWNGYRQYTNTCTDGQEADVRVHNELVIPAEAADPLDQITGTSEVRWDAPCAGTFEYDLTYDRIGD